MRALRIGLLVAAAFALSGCGVAKQASSEAAKVVPASAPAFVSIDSNLSSDQWKKVDDLLQKFPGRAQALDALRSSLRKDDGLDYEQDVKPALGDEVDAVWLDFANGGSNVVLLTKPKDEQKFKAMIAKGNQTGTRLVVGKVEGWTVLSDSQAKIDRFANEASGPKLVDDSTFKAAMGELPGDAIVKAYAKGSSLLGLMPSLRSAGIPQLGRQGLDYVAADLSAEGDGLRLVGAAKATQAPKVQPEAFKSSFVHEVPGDAIAFLTFKGSSQISQLQPGTEPYFRQFKQLYGVDLPRILGLFNDETAFYIRPQAPIPEFTLLVKTADEAAALGTVDAIARSMSSKLGTTEQAGVTLHTANLGKLTISYGTFDGKLVVTTGDDAVAKLRESGSKLADSQAFKDAKKAAGLPDETSGFAYVDLKDAIPLVERFIQTSGSSVPPTVKENLAPLSSLLLWGDSNGQTQKLTVFLRVD